MPTDSRLRIESARGSSGELRLTLNGCIDEYADLSVIRSVEEGALVLDLSGVRRINSIGVREWILSMMTIPPEVAVFWERVSVPMVSQLGMIANFHGHSRIRSFYAPYFCSSCRADQARLLSTSEDFRDEAQSPPPQECEHCERVLEFDDVESDYLQAVLQTR